MNISNKTLTFIIFFGLLILSNFYLLRSGFWFFQDAGYWPKTSQEAWMMFSQQFHVFTNFGYSLGFDQGLFSFTRIVVQGFILILFYFFGHAGSQIAFVLSGYILTFISFYLFSGIFFENKTQRYILAILYTFNPLSYSLQGAVFFNAISPLFLYAYYKYFYDEKQIRLAYLLLGIFSSYLWVSYIRFIQSNFIVIVPYLICFFFMHKKKIQLKKIVVLFIAYILVFLPIIFSFISQILEKSPTAFNYGKVLGIFADSYPFYTAFNLFQSIAPRIYEGKTWQIIGIIFFLFILYLFITFPKNKYSSLYFLNLGLVILGITFYALANIFGEAGYFILIKIFPFIINEPFWGFYVLGMPIIILIGIVTEERIKYLYLYSTLFVLLAMLPLLNLGDFQLQKYNLAQIPRPYYDYFIKPNNTVPESTYFLYKKCWRAQFMNDANTPTFCPNYGLRFVSVLFDDPRLTSGETFNLADSFYGASKIDNLRVTHNLKDIIVPNDIVKNKIQGRITEEEDVSLIKTGNADLQKNKLLSLSDNDNFNHYFFTDKEMYDFFIYSPKTVIYKDIRSITDNSLKIKDRPIVLSSQANDKVALSQNVRTAYKMSLTDPTSYYMRISRRDVTKPFMLQINQAYSSSWQIKWIDKKTFDTINCQSRWSSFTITNNERCIYNNGLLNFKSTTLLSYATVPLKRHTVGNYLGNNWLIFPEDIPYQLRNDRELYAVIIYIKQIYYTYTLLIACGALLILVILSCIQEIFFVVKHKQE